MILRSNRLVLICTIDQDLKVPIQYRYKMGCIVILTEDKNDIGNICYSNKKNRNINFYQKRQQNEVINKEVNYVC